MTLLLKKLSKQEKISHKLYKQTERAWNLMKNLNNEPSVPIPDLTRVTPD